MTKTVTVLSGLVRPLIESRLPDWVEPRFFQSKEEAMALAPEADIGWFDMYDKRDMAAAITAATKMRWLNSIYAGVDGIPLGLLAERGTVLTNGVGGGDLFFFGANSFQQANEQESFTFKNNFT
ncbi:MAG: hypothetical protein ACT6Q3_15155, partial [Sphingopyxis sp.]